MRQMSKPKPGRHIDVDESQARSLFDEFEIGLCRAASDADPRNLRALEFLGQALTRALRHQEALEVDLRLTHLRPRDPVVFYNLACSYSNLEDLDGAFAALRRAFELGYNDYPHLLRDPDLQNLRRDRRFKALLDKKWGKRQP
jgi:tetratricopeptide (TPR) repeat protein